MYVRVVDPGSSQWAYVMEELENVVEQEAEVTANCGSGKNEGPIQKKLEHS